MRKQPPLRRPRVIGAGNQIAIDAPSGHPLQRLHRLPRIVAGKPEIDRNAPAGSSQGLIGDRNHPLALRLVERHALARGRAENEAIDRLGRIVGDQPAE
ncbi:hypothetical protein D3C87_1815650 [compost metagenome]